jgi:hypothetical protein
VIDDGAVAGAITLWAMSPGDALDAALIYVDASEKINVRAAPAHVEEIGLKPDPDDIKSTDQGWPFEPPPRAPRLDRQDVADALIFIAILAIAGGVIGSYAFALFSLLDGDWVRAAIAWGHRDDSCHRSRVVLADGLVAVRVAPLGPRRPQRLRPHRRSLDDGIRSPRALLAAVVRNLTPQSGPDRS